MTPEADGQFGPPVDGVRTGLLQLGEELLAVIAQVLRQPLVSRIALARKGDIRQFVSRPRATPTLGSTV
jgi:hypothetical protein